MHDCTHSCPRHRPGGLLQGIEKAYLDTYVRPKWDRDLDTRDYRDQHYDLDEDATVKVRPATWEEQVACLMAEDVWVREVGE